MPTKTATKKTPAKKTTTRPPAHRQEPPETTPPPSDPSADRLQAQQDKLSAPGQVSKADAEQIDNDPGYTKDQVHHMQEYWGLKDSTATVADV